jgi:hypothetical protein
MEIPEEMREEIIKRMSLIFSDDVLDEIKKIKIRHAEEESKYLFRPFTI